MESICRNISEFDPPDREAIEHLLGHSLGDDQQVTILVRPGDASSQSPSLPAWLDLYAGLTDAEVGELEQVILQRSSSARIFE